MSEFVSDGGDRTVSWQKNGFGRESENSRTDGFEGGEVAGANATDGPCENHIPNNSKRGIQSMDLVDCSTRRVTWNGVGADADAADLESLTILNGLTAGEWFGFGRESDRFGAFDDSVEFKNVIPVSMGEKNFGESKFMSFECGEKRIGTSPSVESCGEKSFGVPD